MNFGQANSGGMQIRQNHGGVNIIFGGELQDSIIGGLRGTSASVAASDPERTILESRDRLHAGRRVSTRCPPLEESCAC